VTEVHGSLGVLGVAAAMHAGVLMLAAGLGVVPGDLAKNTRHILLQASLRAVRRPPGERFEATWRRTERLAALVLADVLDLITETPVERARAVERREALNPTERERLCELEEAAADRMLQLAEVKGGDDITQALCDWRPGDDMQLLVDAADEIARLRCDLYDRRTRTGLAYTAIAETVAVLSMADEERRRIDLALLDLDRLARGLTTSGHQPEPFRTETVTPDCSPSDRTGTEK
jgi:hypothetical protein